ncbi:MAG TPA: thioesterase family protein [Kofleriaceae bacterium]|nr:thioesterase family protein [Kofleriaceae bacterium]
MQSLFDVTTPVPDGNAFRLDVPEGWRQGRGAYGGLTVASMIHAIEHRVEDRERSIRSLTAELFAPLAAGPARIEVDRLRHGSSLSALRAMIVQADQPIAHAVALAGRTRSSPAWRDLVAPVAPPWQSIEPMASQDAMMWPEFAQHFEYRFVDGTPMSRASRAVTVGWIRPRDPGPARDIAYIAALADAWYPAALVRMDTMRPLATIAYTLDIVGGVDGLAAEAPLLYRGTVPVMGEGYFLETRELWGEDGRLVAINQQTFAVIQ